MSIVPVAGAGALAGLAFTTGYRAYQVARRASNLGRDFVRRARREQPKKLLWKVQGPGQTFIKEPAEKRQKTNTGIRGYQPIDMPKAAVWRDSTSYVQLEEKKDKSGKYVLKRTRRNYLLDTLTQRIRYRFGRVQDINAATGSYWLSNRSFDATWRRLPVYIMPLFGINQAGGADNTTNAHYGMYELMVQQGANPGQFQWRRVPGLDPTITAATNAFSPKAVMPSDTSTPLLGRKAMCDWTRIKLCIWGKAKNPTSIRVSVVKFFKRNYTVEDNLNKTAGTSDCDTDGNAFWASRMKYLLNGHNSGYGRNNDFRVMKVLKKYEIMINPIDAGAETAASDSRPHMKHLDLFYRWNRILDFTVPTTGATPTYTEILAQNRVPDINVAYSAYLNDPQDMVYLLVESVQPLADDTNSATDPRAEPTDTTLTASFDVSLESSWSHIQRLS